MKVWGYFLVIFLALSPQYELISQELELPTIQDFDLLQTKDKIGLSLGYGGQYLLPVSYKYDVILFQFHYFRKAIGNSLWALDIQFMPNFVLSNFRNNEVDNQRLQSFEFGLNGGLVLRRRLFSPKSSLYLALSLGPHYINNTPDRQKSGFIFSDNISIGYLHKIHPIAYLDCRMSMRHVSNAELEKPNKGINNLILYVGVVVPIE